jgi:hypothetical protein
LLDTFGQQEACGAIVLALVEGASLGLLMQRGRLAWESPAASMQRDTQGVAQVQ